MCKSEDQARKFAKEMPSNSKIWPCLFTCSDTTGEKDFEEFFTENEILDMHRFENLGVIKNELNFDETKLDFFTSEIIRIQKQNCGIEMKLSHCFMK